MLISAYMPLGISWLIVLVDDSQNARNKLSSGIEMAGLGPFALLWVGWATFAMSAKSGGVLTSANLGVFIFAIIYPVINIALAVMHYHVSPPMYAWLAVAPLRANPIDSAKPWNQPAAKVVYAEAPATVVVVEEPVAEAEAEVEAEVDVEVAAEEPAAADADADADFEEGDEEGFAL